jgi:hypothetical protein
LAELAIDAAGHMERRSEMDFPGNILERPFGLEIAMRIWNVKHKSRDPM